MGAVNAQEGRRKIAFKLAQPAIIECRLAVIEMHFDIIAGPFELGDGVGGHVFDMAGGNELDFFRGIFLPGLGEGDFQL